MNTTAVPFASPMERLGKLAVKKRDTETMIRYADTISQHVSMFTHTHVFLARKRDLQVRLEVLVRMLHLHWHRIPLSLEAIEVQAWIYRYGPMLGHDNPMDLLEFEEVERDINKQIAFIENVGLENLAS